MPRLAIQLLSASTNVQVFPHNRIIQAERLQMLTGDQQQLAFLPNGSKLVTMQSVGECVYFDYSERGTVYTAVAVGPFTLRTDYEFHEEEE